MAVQTPPPSQSRRAILAAALGAGAATIASAIGRPLPAAAADGDPVTVGGSFVATNPTRFVNSTNTNQVLMCDNTSGNGIAAVQGNSTLAGTGLSGGSDTGHGVEALSNSGEGLFASAPTGTGAVAFGTFGVFASSVAAGVGVYASVTDAVNSPDVFGKTAVIGQSDAGGTAVVGFTGPTAHQPPPDTGIYGRSDTGGAGGRGLTGFCSTGIGLLGQTDTGVGVRVDCGNNTGVGLLVTGKAAFARSGKLTIAAGHSSLTKTGIGLTSISFILATLQSNVAGLFIQAVVTNPAGSAFTIYLNKAPTISVVVAWMAVN
jgi:hypothetical protein